MTDPGASTQRDLEPWIGRVPAYPLVIAVALIVALFNESAAAPHALPRPLLIALLLASLVQVGLTLAIRDRHLAAIAALVVVLLAGDLIPLLAVMLNLLLVLHLVRRVRRLDGPWPWRRLTELLNIVAGLALLMTVLTGWLSGAYPAQTGREAPMAGRGAAGPEVFVIMLDGYPRADTLANEFGFDNSPFLQRMEQLGFGVARGARSNYNLTTLTLATMLNGTQARDLPELDPEPSGLQAQYRSLSAAISRASMLDGFRTRGYEIVSVASPFTVAELGGSDRMLDSGGVNEFEVSLATALGTRHILPGLQRQVFSDSLRERTKDALDMTAKLAADRGGPPKFVFTHVMSPHMPVLWSTGGREIDGWECFPESCSLWTTDARDASERLPIDGQLEALNRLVVDAVVRIQAQSTRPPVIIVFSDHGYRHDYDDRDEMFRSLFLSSTPGQVGLFPDDVTPVNMLARLLNAYHRADHAFVTEESYVVDMQTVSVSGPLPESAPHSAR